MTSLVLASLLVAAPAPTTSATPAVPTPTATDEFVLIVGKSQIGTESVSRLESETGESLRGKAELASPAGTTRLEYKLDLAAGKATRYQLAIVGNPSGGSVTATATETGWKFEAKGEGATTPMVVERPVTGRSIVLDNNLASHLDLLARTLELTPGTKISLTAVVPQALQVFPIEVERLNDQSAMRRYRLTMASVLIEVDARASDGALLEARVPLQSAIYRRKGWEPPTQPKAADAREREITVPSPVGDLPAVLVVPASEKPAAAVLLLSGSGPQDRDETIGPNKPLRDVALGLADRGIASLRFDKRTHAFPAKSEATLAAEYLDDAVKALEVLRVSPGVDPKRLFVAGHSLGGLVAPLVASRSNGTARGLILLAPAVRRVDALVIDQVATQARLSGLDEAAVKAQVAEITKTLAAALDPAKKDAAPVMGVPASYWQEVAALDLGKMLADSSLPFLVLQGDKDIQVRADLDFAPLRSKLGEANGRASYKLFPGLNHLFMPVDTASTGADYAIAGHVAPEVVTAIADWISGIAH